MSTMLEDLAEVIDEIRRGDCNDSECLALANRLTFTQDTIAQNAEEIAKMRSLCAAVYQAAGAYDMPERFLDALSDAANGQIQARRRTDDLLPCDAPPTSRVT